MFVIQNWFAQRNRKQQTGTINVMERPSAADRFTLPPKDANTVERTFNKCEIQFLRKEFAKNRHPGSLEFILISQELRVPVKNIKVKHFSIKFVKKII